MVATGPVATVGMVSGGCGGSCQCGLLVVLMIMERIHDGSEKTREREGLCLYLRRSRWCRCCVEI